MITLKEKHFKYSKDALFWINENRINVLNISPTGKYQDEGVIVYYWEIKINEE